MDLDNFLLRINLKNRQRHINKMFEREGLTGAVLKEQIELNRKRHLLDVPDSSEVIISDDGMDFVQ